MKIKVVGKYFPLAFGNSHVVKDTFNKTENHFSPYPRSEGDINLYTRLKIAIAGKACKKLLAYGRLLRQ
jgi:hypothetical protein